MNKQTRTMKIIGMFDLLALGFFAVPVLSSYFFKFCPKYFYDFFLVLSTGTVALSLAYCALSIPSFRRTGVLSIGMTALLWISMVGFLIGAWCLYAEFAMPPNYD